MIQKSISLKYEPSSEPLHNSAEELFAVSPEVCPSLSLSSDTGSPNAYSVEVMGAMALLPICDTSFPCEDYNLDRVHPCSPFPLRRVRSGPGPHIFCDPQTPKRPLPIVKGTPEKVSRRLSEKWRESRPESDPDCLICAEFARQLNLLLDF